MSGNKIVVKKLTSAGKVDETYKACQTLATLRDVIYEVRNPGLIYALTDTSNELLMFKLVTAQADCQVLGKVALSEVDDRSIFDQINMFGSLIVARNSEDASLHLFLNN